jgi:aminotransferase EvaB
VERSFTAEGRVATRVPLNDLRRRSRALGTRLEAALQRVASSGWYLHGPEVAGFEEEFSDFIGVSNCVAVASGTDALQLSLLAAGCEPGDEIVTAANAGGYTTTAALAAGLQPRYADVSAASLCLTAASVTAALTNRTRAVVVTHLYGQLADVEAIVAVCRERSIRVIEDCAQATGATRGGQRAGAFGDAAVFSFYPTKNLGAVGDAGAVLTDDPEIAASVRQLAEYGWADKYRVAVPRGRNSRMDELQAAALRVGLPLLDGWNDRRRAIVEEYAAAARSGCFFATSGPDYVGHLAVLLADDRDALAARFELAGVATAIHYPIPDHQQPAWREAHRDVTLPVTEDAVGQILTVPCFPELEDHEVETVTEVLHAA